MTMSEEGPAQNRKYESEIAANHDPDWAEISGKFVMAILLFLSSVFFAVTLSDIKGFIEDHGFEFQYIEIFIILGFLAAFYIGSKIIFCAYAYAYNIVFPRKKCQIDELYQLVISISISAMYMGLIIIFWVPALAPVDGAERNMLYWTVFWWLLSILFMNVLLNSGRFGRKIDELTYKNVLYLFKHKFNRRNVNE
jgi:hypothetical protein